MVLLLDLVIVLIFILCVVIGYKNGIIRVAAGLFGGIVSFFLAKLAASAFAGKVAALLPAPALGEAVSARIHDAVADSETALTVSGLLQKLGVSESLTEQLREGTGSALAGGAAEAVDHVTDALCYLLGYCIVFLVTLVLAALLIRLLCVWLKVFEKLPVLRTVNRLAGILVGAASGVFFAWLFAVLFAWLGPVVGNSVGLNVAALDPGRTFLYQYLSAFNPITALVSAE